MACWDLMLFFFHAYTLFHLVVSIQIVFIESFDSFLGVWKNFFDFLEKSLHYHIGPIKSFLIFSLSFHFHELAAKFFKVWQVFEQRISIVIFFRIFDQDS